jgi:Holliday junction DNA helicase RuvA
MIASIKGEVSTKCENDLVINVGGIGFKIMAPKAACAKAIIGNNINLFTHLVVREDSLTIYGFESREERDLYILLLSVNGVGPKTALAIISTLSVDVIISAALANRDEVFCQVPGIGRKSAQKIIIYMHDKVSQMTSKEIIPGFKDINAEVIDALVGLGYSVVEAQTAIQSIPRDAPDDLESRLRIALLFFSA